MNRQAHRNEVNRAQTTRFYHVSGGFVKVYRNEVKDEVSKMWRAAGKRLRILPVLREETEPEAGAAAHQAQAQRVGLGV